MLALHCFVPRPRLLLPRFVVNDSTAAAGSGNDFLHTNTRSVVHIVTYYMYVLAAAVHTHSCIMCDCFIVWLVASLQICSIQLRSVRDSQRGADRCRRLLMQHGQQQRRRRGGRLQRRRHAHRTASRFRYVTKLRHAHHIVFRFRYVTRYITLCVLPPPPLPVRTMQVTSRSSYYLPLSVRTKATSRSVSLQRIVMMLYKRHVDCCFQSHPISGGGGVLT